MPQVNEKLLRKATGWTASRPETRGPWHLIVQGIELGWLDTAELRGLLTYLSDGADYGIEELLFAVVGDDVEVSFLDDRTSCPTQFLIDELSAFMAAS